MSKLELLGSENYAAVVVEIKTLIPLPGLDNLVAAPLLGYQALVSKDTKVGDIGIVFTAETQLSEEYARRNNLHRHSDRNVDQSLVGYLEDNRRVKAIKLRGHRSDALFMPLRSLDYTISGLPGFPVKPGDTFDTLNGHEICRKFTRPVKQQRNNQPKISRLDSKMLPEHFETSNYYKNTHMLVPGDRIVITQKLHGTSVRIGHTVVQRKLSWREKLARRLGVKVQDTEYDYVFGSRKVIKDPNDTDLGFYGYDLWTEHGRKLEGLLPKGYVVYGEIIGWTKNGSGIDVPIQKNYTYGLPIGKSELYVYRVTYVNPDGYQTDLAWDEVKEFCEQTGLKHVPELMNTFWLLDLWHPEYFLDRRLCEEYGNALPVGKGMVDEGICVRRDGLRPLILKAKSPIFLQYETKMLDREEVDIESDG